MATEEAVNWLEKIKEVRKYLDTDPSLVAYCVREWTITEQAELKDLAWAMCKESGYVVKGDAEYLLDALEEYLLPAPKQGGAKEQK